MLEQAVRHLKAVSESGSTFFNPDWHEGVVGILASRLKDRLHLPVICFARGAAGGVLEGAGRSVPAPDLGDGLDLGSKRAPGLVLRFGGHAQAAGRTIAENGFARFAQAL